MVKDVGGEGPIHFLTKLCTSPFYFSHKGFCTTLSSFTMNNEALIAIDRRLAVSSNQILMLKADINYTHIFMEDGSSVTSSRTLGIFEQYLSNQAFFRPNRSVIINLNFMVDFQREMSTIRMENDESIIISRRRVKSFLRKSKTIRSREAS